jgi:hypothetical protein
MILVDGQSQKAVASMSVPLTCQCGLVRGQVLKASGGMRVVCYCDDCEAFARALHRPEILEGMFRWHTACCSAPIGSTMASLRFPFIGLLTAFVDVPESERDTGLGPPVAWVHGRFAIGDVPARAHQAASPGLMARFLWRITKGFVTGAFRPTPLFDASGQPVVVPPVLTVAEREALRIVP